MCKVGQNHTFIGIYGIFGREITIHTVVYGVCVRFWPTLGMCKVESWPVPYIYGILLQGSHQIYGHIRRIYIWFGSTLGVCRVQPFFVVEEMVVETCTVVP